MKEWPCIKFTTVNGCGLFVSKDLSTSQLICKDKALFLGNPLYWISTGLKFLNEKVRSLNTNLGEKKIWFTFYYYILINRLDKVKIFRAMICPFLVNNHKALNSDLKTK